MTPNLGQGARQALEDAAAISWLAAGTGPDAVTGMLARYTAARLPRTTDVVRWSRRAATMTTWASPPAVTFRNTVARLTSRLAPEAALRGLAAIYGWQPPAAARPGDAGRPENEQLTLATATLTEADHGPAQCSVLVTRNVSRHRLTQLGSRQSWTGAPTKHGRLRQLNLGSPVKRQDKAKSRAT